MTPTLTGPLEIRFPQHRSPAPAPVRRGLLATAATAEAAPTSDQTADTFGWDTVFAITFADVNKQLAKPGVTPARFDASAEGMGQKASGSGTFGPWQCTGGSGSLLHMTLPITDGTLTVGGKQAPLKGAGVQIEVRLEYLSKAPDPARPAAGRPANLVVDQTEAVSVVDVKSDTLDFMGKAFLSAVVAKWANDHLKEFKHVFSTVSLDERADREQFQWLKPTGQPGYAVLENHATPADGLFAVLNMTEGRPPPTSDQVSPFIIPPGARSGFLISAERFVQKLLRPQLAHLFQNAKDDGSDFAPYNDGRQVRNKTPLAMPDTEIAGVKYKTQVDTDNCAVTFEGQDLLYQLKVHVPAMPGIDVYLTYETRFTLKLVKAADGTKMVYEQAQPTPKVDHYVVKADWVTWTEAAAGVVAAIVGFGVGKMAQQVTQRMILRIVAGIIAAIIAGTIAMIPTIIELVLKGNVDKLPSVDLMIANVTAPIKWPGSTGYEPTAGGLNGSLQIGGDPKFVD